MKVKSIMSREVAVCRPDENIHDAARVMWDHDCGVVPVVDAETGRLEGVCTDRDLCMAALLSNRPAASLPLADVMATEVRTCSPDDDLREVHAEMREFQIRRLPVVDEGRRLIGLVSLNDLANEAFASRTKTAAKRQRDVAKTLAEVSRHYEDE